MAPALAPGLIQEQSDESAFEAWILHLLGRWSGRPMIRRERIRKPSQRAGGRGESCGSRRPPAKPGRLPLAQKQLAPASDPMACGDASTRSERSADEGGRSIGGGRPTPELLDPRVASGLHLKHDCKI